jgi:hypothetical protein
MARVILCRSPSGEAVALKWLDDVHDAIRDRFAREIETLERLDHPGLVGMRGHGVHDGRPFLVMDLVDGSDLIAFSRKLHQRPPAERYRRCREVGMALCGVVGFLHDQGLVHRDIKPSNVLLTQEGTVRLGDFGVVKDLADPEKTAIGLLVGTPNYAAPEQLEGEAVDLRTDLYGVGATLFFMLTLKAPFEHVGVHRVPDMVPPAPSGFDPSVPPDLEATILRLMAIRPADRFARAEDAVAALNTKEGRGIVVAGRQHVMASLAVALGRAREGVPVLLQLVGPAGLGKAQVSAMVRAHATRSGVPCFEVWGEGSEAVAYDRMAQGAGMVVVTPHAIDVPPGVEVHPVCLHPLGPADVRRTVVGAARRTRDRAQVSVRLRRATGGLPELLVPLIEQHVEARCLELPDPVPVPAELHSFMGELDLDELDVLGAIVVAGRPLSRTTLEAVVPTLGSEVLEDLTGRSLISWVDDHAWIHAGLVHDHILASLPDPDGLRARMPPETPHPWVGDLVARGGAQLWAGDLVGGLATATRAIQWAEATGDVEGESQARILDGLVWMAANHPIRAEKGFADVTALAKAADLGRQRRLAHVLRAACALMLEPGDRTRAASAIDRILPMHRVVERDGPLATGLLNAVWACAAKVLGDAKTHDHRLGAARQSMAELKLQGSVGHIHLLATYLAFTSWQGGSAREVGASVLGMRASESALLRWWSHALVDTAQGNPPPRLDSLQLTPEMVGWLRAFGAKSGQPRP